MGPIESVRGRKWECPVEVVVNAGDDEEEVERRAEHGSYIAAAVESSDATT